MSNSSKPSFLFFIGQLCTRPVLPGLSLPTALRQNRYEVRGEDTWPQTRWHLGIKKKTAGHIKQVPGKMGNVFMKCATETEPPALIQYGKPSANAKQFFSKTIKN